MAKCRIPKLVNLKMIEESLTYDSVSGILTWKYRPEWHFKSTNSHCRWNTRYSGAESGCIERWKDRPGEYLKLSVNKIEYRAHRICWYLHHREWPTLCIDHINGNGLDNRIVNLRMATPSDNMRNRMLNRSSSSKVMGVSWSIPCGKWRAYIWIDGKQKHLGVFDNIEDAKAARIEACDKYGYHENHGRDFDKKASMSISKGLGAP